MIQIVEYFHFKINNFRKDDGRNVALVFKTKVKAQHLSAIVKYTKESEKRYFDISTLKY